MAVNYELQMWRVLTVTAIIAGLCVPSFMVARAQDLPVFSNSESRLEKACTRTIESYLLKPSTTGDIAETCDCVDKAVAAANWPEQYTEDLFIKRDAEYFYFYGIANISSAGARSLVSPAHKIIAQDLAWDVRACMAPHALHEDMRYMNIYPGELGASIQIAEVIDGPATSRVRGVSGLFETAFEPLRGMISQEVAREKAVARQRGEGYNPRDPSGSSEARKYRDEIGETLAETKILSCSYVTQSKTGRSRGISSRPYYYWYGQEPDGFATLKANLSSGNPARSVGAARSNCPPSRS